MMNAKVNYHLQDGSTLDETTTRNITLMTEKDFEIENQTLLQNCIADATAKETAQKKAASDLSDKTAEQNTAISETQELIKKIRGAVITGYDSDVRTQKLFNIGKRLPYTLNGLRSESEYLSTVVPGKEPVLLKSGLVQADITALTNAPARLVKADKAQEDAKKIGISATLTRDESIKKLKAIKKKIRNFVKTAFQGNEAILVQFEPIPEGRGGGNGGGDTPPTPPPDAPKP